jgi:hypothetical protein
MDALVETPVDHIFGLFKKSELVVSLIAVHDVTQQELIKLRHTADQGYDEKLEKEFDELNTAQSDIFDLIVRTKTKTIEGTRKKLAFLAAEEPRHYEDMFHHDGMIEAICELAEMLRKHIKGETDEDDEDAAAE